MRIADHARPVGLVEAPRLDRDVALGEVQAEEALEPGRTVFRDDHAVPIGLEPVGPRPSEAGEVAQRCGGLLQQAVDALLLLEEGRPTRDARDHRECIRSDRDGGSRSMPSSSGAGVNTCVS